MGEKKVRDSELMRSFLIELRSGCTISEACRRLGINRDNELRSLRRKYPDFHAQLGAIRHGKDRAEKLASWTEAKEQWGSDFSEDARIEMFLLTYRENGGDRSSAATASGFLPSTVEAMLNPESKKFNSEFARAMKEENIRQMWEVEDEAKRKARMGDGNMQRFVLKAHLPEYSRPAGSATEANVSQFDPNTLRKAMEELRKDLLEFRQSSGRVKRADPDAGPGKPPADDGGVEPVSGEAPDEAEIN